MSKRRKTVAGNCVKGLVIQISLWSRATSGTATISFVLSALEAAFSQHKWDGFIQIQMEQKHLLSLVHTLLSKGTSAQIEGPAPSLCYISVSWTSLFTLGKLQFYCFMNKIFVDQLENDQKTDLKCMHFAIHSEGGHSTIVYTKLLSMCHYLNRQPKTGGSVWKRWKMKRPISSGIVIIWYGNRAMLCLKTALHFRV